MASVRKRGETFTITAYMGYDDSGKQVKKTTTFRPPNGVTPGKAEKLANAYAAQWEKEIQGYTSLDENRTFAELTEWYYTTIAPEVLKHNVLITNRRNIKTYVLPKIGRERLKNITPSMLDSLFRDLEKNGRIKRVYRLIDGFTLEKSIAIDCGITIDTIKRISAGSNVSKEYAEKISAYLGKPLKELFIPYGNQELSVGTIKKVKNCISAIFTMAVRKEIMLKNPCSRTTIKRVPKAAESFLDDQQALILVNALDKQDDFQFKVMIIMLLFTGMRGGELCGLLWQDIDLDSGIISIRNTLVYNEDQPENRYSIQTAKTDASVRNIIVPPAVISLLMEYKQQQAEKMLALGWERKGLVFTSVKGTYFSEVYLNRKFKKFAKKINLPDGIHIHSLRHTNASLLINSDVPAKVISDQLGHASVSVTLDLYSHVFASSKAKAAQALELKLLQTR